jgi:branched-chain amino acid transport system permease protein
MAEIGTGWTAPRRGRGAPQAVFAAAIAGVAAVFPILVSHDSYYLYLGATGLLFAALASAWNLLAYAGQISFGHAAFFGAGAYASALLALGSGLNPWLGVPAACLAGAGVAVPVGLAAHRLSGAYLALATLAYAEVWRVVAHNWTDLTGGGSGLIGIPALPAPPGLLSLALGPERARSYYLALGLLALALVAFATLRRTRVGLAWAAIREREQRAELCGIRPTPYKVLGFVCSGVLTAAGGAIYAHTVRFVEPDLVFGRSMSILPLVMATFGGVRTLWGPPAGALVLHLASELVLSPLLPGLHQLPYALALAFVVLRFPRGLGGLGRRQP